MAHRRSHHHYANHNNDDDTNVDNLYDDDDNVDDDDDETYSPLISDRNRSGSNESSSHLKQPALKRQTSATLLRQSRPYVLFNVAVLVLLTVLLVWVATAPGHYPTSPIFVMLEILVTTIVTFEVGLEIAYEGCYSYFFPDVLPGGTSLRLHCSRIAIHLWNWFQFFLVLLCVMSLILFLRGVPESSEEKEEAELDNALILAALIGRYVFYVMFVCILQWKVTQSQGGWGLNEFKIALTSCLLCNFHVTPPLKQQWDIMIEEEEEDAV